MTKEHVPNEGKDKLPGEELSEVEISNLPSKEFKVMIIKKLNKLRERMNGHSEKLKKRQKI